MTLQRTLRRLAVMVGLAEDDPDAKLSLAAFRQGLEALGWSEGHNVRIDIRFAPAVGADQMQELGLTVPLGRLVAADEVIE